MEKRSVGHTRIIVTNYGRGVSRAEAWLLAVSILGVAALSAVAYWRSHQQDPGSTGEIVLLLTVLLGGLALRDPSGAGDTSPVRLRSFDQHDLNDAAAAIIIAMFLHLPDKRSIAPR
jgi:hypothetical protein